MRELNECKAEVFRRSDNRIKARRRNLGRVLALCIPLCLILTVFSVTVLPAMMPETLDNASGEENYTGGAKHDGNDDHSNTVGSVNSDVPEDISFSLTWNTYGIGSYDSATERLMKNTDATNSKDCVIITTLHLDDTQLLEIRKLLGDLDIETYPDEYDPHGGLSSDSSMTLILTLRKGDNVKTVRAEDIALSYESDDPKGQKFLDTCKGILDILTATEAWKALPEYE